MATPKSLVLDGVKYVLASNPAAKTVKIMEMAAKNLRSLLGKGDWAKTPKDYRGLEFLTGAKGKRCRYVVALSGARLQFWFALELSPSKRSLIIYPIYQIEGALDGEFNRTKGWDKLMASVRSWRPVLAQFIGNNYQSIKGIIVFADEGFAGDIEDALRQAKKFLPKNALLYSHTAESPLNLLNDTPAEVVEDVEALGIGA